jgi:hypothetical protein
VVTYGKCFLNTCACIAPVVEPSDVVMLTYRLFLVNSDSSKTLECLHAHLPDTVMQLNKILLILSGLISSHLAKLTDIFCHCYDGTFQRNTGLLGIPCYIMCCVYKIGQSVSMFFKHLDASFS